MSKFQHVVIKDGTTGVEARVEENGGLAVNMQDQTSEPIDALFAQSVSNFTLSVDTVASTATSLVYTFTATAGHLIVVGDEILLLDIVGDRSFFAVVTDVATNVITIDRPIDAIYPSATTLGRRVTTEMAADGSSTPQIFSVRSGVVASDITRVIITMLSGSAMDDSKFGSLTALTNGLVFRIVNSFQKTIYNFKTNSEIIQFAYDGRYSDRSAAGQFGFNARSTFAGQAKHGVALRIANDDVLQWVVQDDLTDLISLKVSAQGHKVTD